MKVLLFPNPRRPGLGLKPRRESQRPHLPQHARHCPVLEAGSALGFMNYPPLGEQETCQISFEGEGLYRFVYSVNPDGQAWRPIVSIDHQLPVGGIGAATDAVTVAPGAPPEVRQVASLLFRMFIAVDDLGTPSGAVTLRGAWNFQTPPGWDTVYTPIFNTIERPIAPMLIVRVETDWFAHDTEFRYVLQPGESITASHSVPIGQTVFVPREEVTLQEASEADIAERDRSRQRFFAEKSGSKQKTPYGLEFSPHYLRMSRQQSKP